MVWVEGTQTTAKEKATYGSPPLIHLGRGEADERVYGQRLAHLLQNCITRRTKNVPMPIEEHCQRPGHAKDSACVSKGRNAGVDAQASQTAFTALSWQHRSRASHALDQVGLRKCPARQRPAPAQVCHRSAADLAPDAPTAIRGVMMTLPTTPVTAETAYTAANRARPLMRSIRGPTLLSE